MLKKLCYPRGEAAGVYFFIVYTKIFSEINTEKTEVLQLIYCSFYKSLNSFSRLNKKSQAGEFIP